MRFGGILLVWLSVVGAAVAAPTDPASQRALAHYQLGIKHYNVSEWEQALKEFRDAYFERSDPSLLFNIAQCQRQLKQWEAAEKSFRTYLRESPTLRAEQQESVRKLIEQMVDAQRKAAEAAPPIPPPQVNPSPTPEVTATPSSTPTVTAEPVAKTPLYKRWYLWVPIAVVVVGVGVGVGVGVATSGTKYPAVGATNASFHF